MTTVILLDFDGVILDSIPIKDRAFLRLFSIYSTEVQAKAERFWAQTRGISKVEVQIDDDDFVEAELAEALNDDTWRQWRLDWDATEGNHRLTVRSTDGDGRVQTDERAELLPDGASGWQSRLVTVRAA